MNELIRDFFGYMVIVIVLLLSIRHHRNKTTAKITPTGMDNSIESWQNFYRKYFGLVVDFSNVRIPNNPGGFERIIFIPKGLKLNDVLKTRAAIKWWTFAVNDDLDKVVTENVRNPTQAYAIRCRERVEADVELKDLSADYLKAKGVNCMTLLERAVYGLKHFSESGQHLDIVNVTLCAGSRDSDRLVPSMGFLHGIDEVNFDTWRPDLSDDRLRARQAVS